MSCIALPLASAFFRPAGASVSPGQQHVGVVLRVGVEPRDGDADVAVQHVARQDDRVLAELFALLAFPLDLDARLEPGAESLIVGALPPPPHQIARPGRARHDDLLREHRLRHLPDQRRHLLEERLFLGKLRRDELERQPLSILEFRRPRGAERGAHALQLAARQAVAERKRRRAVDADDLRLPLLDHLLERHPLLVAPELGLASADRRGDGLHRAARVEDAALRGPAERDPFDARRRQRPRRPPRTCRRTRRWCAGARRRSRAR